MRSRTTAKDPVALRLELLTKQPREAAVVRLAAEKAGWNRPFPKGKGRARGFAFHRAQTNTRVAMVSEVTLSGPTIKVERVVAAVDCGAAVNPDVGSGGDLFPLVSKRSPEPQFTSEKERTANDHRCAHEPYR